MHTIQMYQVSMSFDFGSVYWIIMSQGYLYICIFVPPAASLDSLMILSTENIVLD